MTAKKSAVARMDAVVNDFMAAAATSTVGCARMTLRHRLNTRQRSSVLKLKVAGRASAALGGGSRPRRSQSEERAAAVRQRHLPLVRE
jgi:hypothetical protein